MKPIDQHAQSLEVAIEDAWLKLAKLARDDSRTVYLSRWQRSTVRIVGIDRVAADGDDRANRHEVGTYGSCVTLQQFREDVFFVFDQMQGRGAA